MEENFIDFLKDLDNRINAGYSDDDIKTLIGQKIKKIERSIEAKAVRQNESQKKICPICNGRGKNKVSITDWDKCRRCDGKGQID